VIKVVVRRFMGLPPIEDPLQVAVSDVCRTSMGTVQFSDLKRCATALPMQPVAPVTSSVCISCPRFMASSPFTNGYVRRTPAGCAAPRWPQRSDLLSF
jgi:hypothetical protein